MVKRSLVIAAGSFVVILIASISSGFFSIWMFLSLVFMIILYFSSQELLKRRLEEVEEQKLREENDRKKFGWCFSRVSGHLNKMPEGQGIEWDSGLSTKSSLQYKYDGIQMHPFRSFEAKMKDSQNRVIIIYDIDGDDIAEFHANPSPEKFKDHFKGFNPYGKSVGRPGLDRGGGRRDRRKKRSRSGVSINIGDDDYEDFDDDDYSGVVDDSKLQEAAKNMK